MTISTFERNATIAEMAVEMDRRGAVIERLEAKISRLTSPPDGVGLTRWRADIDDETPFAEIVQDPDGEWVRHEDAAAALAALTIANDTVAGLAIKLADARAAEAAEKARADDAEAALWRVFPNVHTVEIEGGSEADPFEGPGETYHDAYHREKARGDGLAATLEKVAVHFRAGRTIHAGSDLANEIAALSVQPEATKEPQA